MAGPFTGGTPVGAPELTCGRCVILLVRARAARAEVTPRGPVPPPAGARRLCTGRARPGRLLVGSDHHGHVAPILLRGRLDRTQLGHVLGEPLQQPEPQLGAGLLATAEHDGDLDLVPTFEEAHDVALLGLVVMGVDLRAELLLLDHRELLVAAGLPGLLRALVLELAVVHELADRGRAVAATSTRSSSASCASRRASSMRTMPTCSPFGPTRRTSGTRMRSLMRVSVLMRSPRFDVVARRSGDPTIRSHATARRRAARLNGPNPDTVVAGGSRGSTSSP